MRLLNLATFFLLLFILAPARSEALVVRAGLEQNPPLSFIDEQGNPAGLLVELLDHVAAESGWQVTYVPDSFDRCMQKLSRQEIDLMLTVAYSKERAERFDFNQVNVVANWGVLYSAEANDVQSYFDLQGAKIAVMRKDIHSRALRNILESFSISGDYLEFDDFGQVFSALDSGHADVGVVGRFYALSREQEHAVKATPLIFNPIEIHYATANGINGGLLETLDQYLKSLKADPSSAYYLALDHWLGVPAQSRLPVWLWPGVLALVALLLLSGTFAAMLRYQVKVRTRKLNAEIDKRTKAQLELQTAEQSYRTLVESASVIILRWDTHGNINYVNEFGEDQLGFGRGELTGRNVIDIIVPGVTSDGQDLVEMIQDIFKSPEKYRVVENENLTKSGERIWISWRNQTVCNEAGEIEGILSFGQDISERKKAEQSRLRYDQAKDTFISTAAHELRTPLAAMIGYADLLAISLGEETFSREQRLEFLETISSKGLVLSRIVDDLLDVGRIQKGKPLPLQRQKDSFAALVRHMFRQYTTLNTSHSFRLEIADDICSQQFFDPERMTQVIENLLSNAVKYSADGSEILIELTSTIDGLQVAVSDQGIGMTAEQAEKIFDDFYRVDTSDTAVSGLGLGMYVVRQIVMEHGGRIWVDSVPDVGTRVCFTLDNFHDCG